MKYGRFGVNNGIQFCQFGDTFGYVWGASAIACPKCMPACIQGYANRRLGIFTEFFQVLDNLVRFGVNNGIKFCQFGDTFE